MKRIIFCVVCSLLIILMLTSPPVRVNEEVEETVQDIQLIKDPLEGIHEEIVEEEPKYTEDELFCMAATIYNEAGGDNYSDETRRLVGYVVLNRVNHPNYPDTIREVLEQRSQYGRFYWTGVKFADRHTNPYEQDAVNRAYRIAEEVLSVDSIPIPETVVFQAEFEQGTSIYKYQDGTYFCHEKEVK